MSLSRMFKRRSGKSDGVVSVDQSPAEARRASEFGDAERVRHEADQAFSDGNFKLAEDLYRELHSLAPNLAHPLCRLGEMALKNNDIFAAEAHYREAVTCQPDYCWAHFDLGNWQMSQGLWSHARDSYIRAKELDPNIPGIDGLLNEAVNKADLQEKCAGVEQEADRAFREGNLEVAEELYRELHRLAPNLAHPLCRLGEIALKHNDVAAAEVNYREAVICQPDYAWGHAGLGRCLAIQKKWSLAVPHFAKAQQYKPENVHFQKVLAEALREAASQEGLVSDKLKQADDFFDIGAFADAESLYKGVLDVSDAPPVHVLCRLGGLAKKRGSLDEAENYYRSAVVTREDYAWTHSGLGEVLMAQEKWEEALKELSRAVEIKPDAPRIEDLYRQSLANGGLQRSIISLDLGQIDEGRSALGQALLIYSESQRARDIVQMFQSKTRAITQGSNARYEIEVALNDCYNHGLEQWIASLTNSPKDAAASGSA